VQLSSEQRVLEVGCGTGAVLTDFSTVAGIDISYRSLSLARQNKPGSRLTCADAHSLPFTDQSFDLAVCHFLLLWVQDPMHVLHEMARVVCPGGAVMALAEPDYGGRIDYPPVLEQIGTWQIESLRYQGANPHIGRSLGMLFHKAGIVGVQVGVLGGQWKILENDLTAVEGEWQVIRSDLASLPLPPAAVEVQRLRQADAEARQHGERVLFVPTFYAWGTRPED
jgi:SAM-dependent methyltransferase